MIRVRITPSAIRDIQEQYAYYLPVDPGLAERWLAKVDETLVRVIAPAPRIGPAGRFRSTHLRDLRRHPVRGFAKHLVFYRVEAEGILVVRVLHGARDIERLLGD